MTELVQDGAPAATGSAEPKLKLGALTALVVSALIAAGIFSLPQNMAASAGAGAIIIGWAITFVGMLMLAFVFQTLANRKPDVEGGVYGYARAGFGPYMGFNSAWGYWISAWIGNVSYYVVIFSAFSSFAGLEFFGEGNTLPAILCSSILLWAYHFLICRGIQGAAMINIVTTIAKLIPLGLFLVLVFVAFKIETFQLDFWGRPELGSILDQVKSTMLVTTWVFIGIEGASIFSSRAEKMADVGKATMIGFALSIMMFVAVSLLSLGVLSQPELAALKNPSTAGVLKAAVGDWGATLMNAGLIISVGGALLAWTLLAAEVPYLAGKDGTMPAFLGKTNAKGAPVNALLLTNGLVQLFLIITLFNGSAYLDLLLLATSMILIPYLLCALYAVMIAVRKDGYQGADGAAGKDLAIGVLASVYGCWLLYAAGPKYLLLSMVLYAPGILFYVKARTEQKLAVFTRNEMVLAGIAVLLGLIAAWQLATGALTI
ncbi:arginine-ornithine antiporter [Crenobacter caeni]|uniref:Arginine-ornithine antiporter n=1 Tax=Crenobacter caeni TaxID=2705474 RepID=A0A6B2KS83_9NEIS|nr:arginine-ornithine antiporter [Crenobacter caeni]NDV12931.1 arginine-ornithine antiporter [Crenobacter caeni]